MRQIAHNITGVAEPAQRVAERPAGEERFKTPQTRDETGGTSASAEHRRRPKSAEERSGLRRVVRPFSHGS